MLLGRLRIRGKLAVLVIIPLMAVVGLTIPIARYRVDQARQATETADAVRVADRVGALVQDIQLERMLSIGYLVHTVDPGRVRQQAAKVTAHTAKLLSEATGKDPALRLPGRVSAALAKTEDLAPLRAGVPTGRTSVDSLVSGYGEVVMALLDSLALERSADATTAEGRQVIALDASMRTDEMITLGAARLVVAAATKNPEALLPYYTNLSVLQSSVARFISFATPQQVALYSQTQTTLQRRLGAIDFVNPPTVSGTSVNPLQMLTKVPIEAIYAALEAVVGPGRVVSERIIADVTEQVTDRRARQLNSGYLVVGIALLVVLMASLVSFAVARSVVRPLIRLTRSADRVARITEEELTRVADDETEAPDPVRLDPVQVAALDEIGDLARAFERVQGTAVELVDRQVTSRRNVAQMFGHVGRRTQNLVSRQISIIDRLEAKETNPDRLRQLYRLDHVSCRLRRNAGSLVVLSGASGANEHVTPLPLADVVRLALAEIEDYPRVDILVPEELTVTPSVISDVVLLLAELMENATTYSPPNTRVMVSGQLTAGGVELAVVDHGIGLSEEQLATENARLRRRERLDLAPTGVLGLFVVGRLARRHELQVALTPTPGGGLTAIVQLPNRLITGGRTLPDPVPADDTVPIARQPSADAARQPSAGALSPTGPVPTGGVPRSAVGTPSAVVSLDALKALDPDETPPVPATEAGAGQPLPSRTPQSSGFPLPSRTPQSSGISLSSRTPPSAGTAPVAGPSSFNQSVVSRASRSIATGTSWSAFVPRQRDKSTGSEVDNIADQPTAVLPVVTAEAARALVEDFEAGVRRAQHETQALPVISAGPPPASASNEPSSITPPMAITPPTASTPQPREASTPGAPPTSLPHRATPPAASPPPTPIAPPPLVSPEALTPPPLPRVAPEAGPLTRRRPGATLAGQPEFFRPAPTVVASGTSDPDEARQLVEEFEAGVFRALNEVRSHYRPEG